MGKLDSKTWLGSAREDLRWVEVSMNGKVYFGACFAAQQVVEKAREAYEFAKEIVSFVEGKIAK